MTSFKGWTSRSVVLVTAAALLPLGMTSASAAPVTVSQEPGVTWGVDRPCTTPASNNIQNCAEVRATATIGTTMFIAGTFNRLVDPVTGETRPAGNLAAIDTATGAPVASWPNPVFNGKIFTLVVSGNKLYVGGAFTKMNSKYAPRVVVLDATTGARLPFTTKPNGTVRSLLPVGDKVYVGGRFTAIDGVPRIGAAAVQAETGALDPSFIPKLHDQPNRDGSQFVEVRSFATGTSDGTPTGTPRLYLSGHFDGIDGITQKLIASVDPVTGARDGTFAPRALPGAMDIEGDMEDPLLAGDQVLPVPATASRAAGVILVQSGHANRLYRLNPNGRRAWKLTPDGDPQAAVIIDQTVYVGGHFVCIYSCYSADLNTHVNRMHIAAVKYNGTVANGSLVVDADDNWAPWLGPEYKPYYYGVWTLNVVAGDLWAGGAFRDVRTDVSGPTRQQPKLTVFRQLTAPAPTP